MTVVLVSAPTGKHDSISSILGSVNKGSCSCFMPSISVFSHETTTHKQTCYKSTKQHVVFYATAAVVMQQQYVKEEYPEL